jgi:hypothetical protein
VVLAADPEVLGSIPGTTRFSELRLVALIRTDVSEDRIASIIRVRRIGELETTLAVT